MHHLNRDLTAAGELVGAEGLTPPGQAKLVRAGTNGVPVTDGPFAESTEFLAGYWLVEVESAERAYTIAARVGGARTGRRAAQHSHRGAPGHERAAARAVSRAGRRGGGAYRVYRVYRVYRRAPAARSRGGTPATSRAPRTPSRRRSSRRPSSGPRTASGEPVRLAVSRRAAMPHRPRAA
jgi:hypothetical protein